MNEYIYMYVVHIIYNHTNKVQSSFVSMFVFVQERKTQTLREEAQSQFVGELEILTTAFKSNLPSLVISSLVASSLGI